MAGDGTPRAAGHGSPPSRVAQERLSAAFRERAEAYRQGASVDLTIVEALVKCDEPEAAARTLADHRASLAAMARDLQVVVADAAVEREAERVWEACAAQEMQAVAAEPSGLRRHLLTLTSAAAMALVMLLPAVPGRLSPRTMLTSLDDRGSLSEVIAARERLEAARTWARALRAEQAATAAADQRTATRSDAVRDKIRSILAADDPGGSAAPRSRSTATVTSLDEHRARKGTDGPRAASPQPPAAQAPGPLAPLDDLGKSGPRVVPLALDLGIDPGTLAGDAGTVPENLDTP